MARKEINIFSVSFLDLLSGALAAVLILFVIVPKMTAEDQSTLEVVDEMEVNLEELDSLLQVVQSTIPEADYQEIQEAVQDMQSSIDTLRNQVNNLEQQLENTNQRNRALENQLVQTEERLREIEEALESAQSRPTQEELDEVMRQLAEARAELEEQREESAQGAEGPGASMFGVNAEFALVCDWPENLDVDLYMKNTADGNWVCYNCGDQAFGNYLGDVTSRSTGDGRFEMIYQEQKIIPGNYEVWYHVYSATGTAHITGYAVIHPFSSREKKVKFSNQTLMHTAKPTSGGGIKIGILKVSENNLTLN
jgi:parvulin-like peptidyl-prolyl isomerase